MKTTAKYAPKKRTTIGYLTLLAIAILLMIGKGYGARNGVFILLTDEMYSHISNFSLSMIFCLGIGYVGLLYGAKFRNIVILGVVMIAANFICETLMSFMNTVDILDATYGTLGVFISLGYLFIVNKYGLVENSIKNDEINGS